MATSHTLCFIALTLALLLWNDLTFKQAYCISWCFVLWYEPKFWQLTLGLRAFDSLGNKSSRVTWQTLKCYFFGLLHHNLILIFDEPKFQEFVLNTFQSWNVLRRKVSWYKRKIHLKIQSRWIKHLTSHQKIACWISREGRNGCSILWKVTTVSCRKYPFSYGKWMTLWW